VLEIVVDYGSLNYGEIQSTKESIAILWTGAFSHARIKRPDNHIEMCWVPNFFVILPGIINLTYIHIYTKLLSVFHCNK
jgi:hypothetical protein